MKVVLNIIEWLSSKKTKHAITASVPLLVAGGTGEMPWWQVALALAGVWVGAGVSQGIADKGKEAAKVKAASDRDIAAIVSK